MNWRELLDERQQKEVALAALYARDFNHGTTGHNQLVLIARLAELLDTVAAGQQLRAPDPADIKLSFGKYSGKALGEIAAIDLGYLEWLAGAAREPAIKDAASAVLAAYDPGPSEPEPGLPF